LSEVKGKQTHAWVPIHWKDAQPMQIAMTVGIEHRRPLIPQDCPQAGGLLITSSRPTTNFLPRLCSSV